MFNCQTDDAISKFDIMSDIKCNNFIGSRSCFENLKLLGKKKVFKNSISEADRDYVFEGLDI